MSRIAVRCPQNKSYATHVTFKIHQANYLIDQQIRRLEKDFLEHGGLRERMTRTRLQHRNKPHQSSESHDSLGSQAGKPGSQGVS